MKKLRWNWRWRRWITQQCRVRFPMRSLGLELGLLSQGLSPEMWHCSGFRFRNLTSLNLCFLILKWGEAHFVGKVCLVRALIFVNPLAVRLWRLPLRQWCWGSVAPFMRALGGDGPGLYLLHPGCLLYSACRWRECWIKDVMNFSRFFLEELLKNFPIAQVVNRLLPLAKVLHDSFSSYLIGYTF